MHSTIRWNFRLKINDFNDFSSAVQEANSSQKYLHKMKVQDLLKEDLKGYKSAAKLNKLQPKPHLSDFVSVLFEKGENCLQFENDYSVPYQELNYLTAATYKHGRPKPELKTDARGIECENVCNQLFPKIVLYFGGVCQSLIPSSQ
ncbi:hypothetical protein HHI36_012604 [Cryptolaemus montrouzieri]|uniref:Uncharacterized protein n=1 Tax=Cryptolaemus montrouzieri TaxID=559131 RepID=A0ABD2NF23_9CUCU